ncbi:hypothetical protein Q75_16180 [Bacillus coahuilensis p1.1.43]|uniref:Uncharacterized protein n=1 Tax=Bacillus coahuilensis p1.1.43 TaxID=1150625 RepID=A0A147K489_9BACI|nr:hypothetical protein [Bacillus coahuilensis]KUP04126.1 hypothetical protein Q75_16180 [Bacillus coahuilensis p1.1.43]
MKKWLGVMAFGLFVIAALSYAALFIGSDELLFMAVMVSAVGFILGLFAEKSSYKWISLVGNGLILFVAIVVPMFVTTFIWNTP